eukprot:173318-Alexandrium_andersonii.AAC.1
MTFPVIACTAQAPCGDLLLDLRAQLLPSPRHVQFCPKVSHLCAEFRILRSVQGICNSRCHEAVRHRGVVHAVPGQRSASKHCLPTRA